MASALAPGWDARTDPKTGKTVFSDTVRKETFWELPDEGKRPLMNAGWTMRRTDEGKNYFVSHENEETFWNLPEEALQNKEQMYPADIRQFQKAPEQKSEDEGYSEQEETGTAWKSTWSNKSWLIDGGFDSDDDEQNDEDEPASGAIAACADALDEREDDGSKKRNDSDEEEEEEDPEEQFERTMKEIEEQEKGEDGRGADNEDDTSKSKRADNEDGTSKAVAKSRFPAKYRDVELLIRQYMSDWEDDPFDILAFLLSFSAFHSQQPKGGKPVFDAQVLHDGYYFGLYAAAAYKGSKKNVLNQLKYLKEEDIVSSSWDSKELNGCPAHFLCVDHGKKNIIVSIRGTKELGDVLVDLTAQYVKYKNGYAHSGFVQSERLLHERLTETVASLVDKHAEYAIRIVGHSMGAAIAALYTLRMCDLHPDRDVHGFCYATPCVISHHLIDVTARCITSFVNHYDTVPRVSVGSIQDLHTGMRVFSREAGHGHSSVTAARAMMAIGFRYSPDSVKQLMAKIYKQIYDRAHDTSSEEAILSYPAGNVFQFWRLRQGKKNNQRKTLELRKVTNLDYGMLQVTPSMLKDHQMAGYLHDFETLLNITEMDRQLYMSIPPDRRLLVQKYWRSYPSNDLGTLIFDFERVVKDFQMDTKQKKKAIEAGLLRPFLYLLAMNPAHRAAVALSLDGDLFRMKFLSKDWYGSKESPHREAWAILAKNHIGAQIRAEKPHEKANPVMSHPDWYEMLYRVTRRMTKKIKHCDKELEKDVKNMKKSGRTHNKESTEVDNVAMLRLEDLFVRSIFEQSGGFIHNHNRAKKVLENHADDSGRIVKRLEAQGFSKETAETVAAAHLTMQADAMQYDMICWGGKIRKKDRRLQKAQLGGIGLLAALSGFLLLDAVALIVVAPPLALLPLAGAAAGGVVLARKSGASEIIQIVTAIMDEKINMALAGLRPDMYYKGQIGDVSRKEGSEGQKEGSEGQK